MLMVLLPSHSATHAMKYISIFFRGGGETGWLFFVSNLMLPFISTFKSIQNISYVMWFTVLISYVFSFLRYNNKILFSYICLHFSSPSYYVWGALVIVQIFDFRFLADLHVWGSGESKKHKISMVSGCSLVSMLVC